MTNIASIDIGSHTARLLISQNIGPPDLFRPLYRKRTYIHLAEGFDKQGEGIITPEAVDRTIEALGDFASLMKQYDVNTPHAVSTGVVRRAVNRDAFLNRIHGQTGLSVRAISGEHEALLTCKGVLHSLDMEEGPFCIFDLGGGSTELIFGEREDTFVTSVPLGTIVLTHAFLRADPPDAHEIEALSAYIDEVLKDAVRKEARDGKHHLLVGTGGTVTTLAAMIYTIDGKEIRPERINGLIVEKKQIEDILRHLRPLSIAERMGLRGLDRGRADVILAGVMVVLRILHFFRSQQMTVSLSDLLEGILVAYLRGEEYE
jgi:exopolyphosphatase/guanosine-5'-triphosphate,3'-diphosphate pyrophosphatase